MRRLGTLLANVAGYIGLLVVAAAEEYERRHRNQREERRDGAP